MRRAKKMLLIIGIISIIMMFSGLTSAYIVSKGGAGYWVNITMPDAFWISTVFMLLSSLTIFLAVRFTRQGKKAAMNIMLLATLTLSAAFIYSQFEGWDELAGKGLFFAGDNFLEYLDGDYGKDYYITNQQGQIVDLKNDGHYYDPDDPTGTRIIDKELETYKNPASSYMYGLTILHALHVGGGILYLVYLVIMGAIGRLGPHNLLKVQQGATYWHFVDLLWIYLLLFFYFIH